MAGHGPKTARVPLEKRAHRQQESEEYPPPTHPSYTCSHTYIYLFFTLVTDKLPEKTDNLKDKNTMFSTHFFNSYGTRRTKVVQPGYFSIFFPEINTLAGLTDLKCVKSGA